MFLNNYKIQIISAPTILGLKPGGVEELGISLLNSGLADALKTSLMPIYLNPGNNNYKDSREPAANVLNAAAIRDFSLSLGQAVTTTLKKGNFPFVLGGDCSILIRIMGALKATGTYGLIFLDAHADFYLPEQSVSGEVADMDLAIVTGRGPEILTNINNLKPYVEDSQVIHVGQRDQEETKIYKSEDIRQTGIVCYNLDKIKKRGIREVTEKILKLVKHADCEGFWIHYDTDVLSDDINPAVDYRLPDGLLFEDVEYLLNQLLLTGRITGIGLSIFNPKLDKTGRISKNITSSLQNAFDLKT